MKFIHRDEIDAEFFQYTKDGISRIKEFLGDALVSINKDRHPFAVAELRVRSVEPDGTTISKFVAEGSYIIKRDQHVYSLTAPVFKSLFKEIE